MKHRQKCFASTSINTDEKEKEKKLEKTIAKFFAFHANEIKV